MIFLPWPSYSSCATSSVLLAGQPKREPHSFCNDGRSRSLGGPCRLSSTRTASAPSKSPGRTDNFLRNLTPDNPVLRRVPHLELASRNFRGGDNFKVGDWHEVPNFQLALAHNRQGRRLHAAHADDSARAVPQDDGRGAGERQVVDLICLPARNGGSIKAGIFGIW